MIEATGVMQLFARKQTVPSTADHRVSSDEQSLSFLEY
jgi:hypothetical protein